MNITKTLIDQHNFTKEDLVKLTGASFYSVTNWYKDRFIPLPVYQKKLEELLKKAKAKNGKKVA